MIVLALDTTTRTGSIALNRDGALVEAFAGDGTRTHATRLPGDLLDCLTRHGLVPGDVNLFAVAAGPGSFTGLRIGIATIQGLAFANRRPVVAVSALDALAYSVAAEDEGPLVGAWIDAQRHEVYAELYTRTPPPAPAPAAHPDERLTAADLGELAVVEAAAVGEPSAIAGQWRSRLLGLRVEAHGRPGLVLAGDGAHAYRSVAESEMPGVRVLDHVPLLAPSIARIAERRAGRGLAVAPHAIMPIYVRRPDAELARDRRARPASPDSSADRQPHE